MLKIVAAACLSLISLAATPVLATQYPLTVTDMAGRQVTIKEEPKRVALQDGRDVTLLALLDRADPFARLVVWNNIPSREDAQSWKLLSGAWPASSRAPLDMGFGDDGQVNLEQLIAQRPQLVVAQRRALDPFVAAGVDKRLAELGIALVYVDLFNDPVANAPASIDLLGKILDRETEAAEYTAFYAERLKRLKEGAAAAGTHPRIFIEPLAGRQGPEQCCFTHGNVGWGQLVAAIGAVNIGSELLAKQTGDATLETVLARKPEVYVMSGRLTDKPGAMTPFGYDADAGKIQSALAVLEKRPGFAGLPAARDGRVYGIWHLFYSHPFNIVALEWLAKFAYPEKLGALDPDATYREIVSRFTKIPAEPFIQAAKAPAIAP